MLAHRYIVCQTQSATGSDQETSGRLFAAAKVPGSAVQGGTLNHWVRCLVAGLALAAPFWAPAPARPVAATSFGTGQLGVLSSVSAVSANDAWAVGEGTDAVTGAHTTLALHWNGATWAPVASPNPGGTTTSGENSALDGVSAVSAKDVWAVGSYANPTTGAHESLVEHWNGSGWRRVASPNPGGTASSGSGTNLQAVSAVSAKDLWVVGGYLDPASGADRTLIWHGDGKRWTRVSSPSPGGSNQNDLSDLDGVHGVSARDAWAVGEYSTKAKSSGRDTVVLHWNGTRWTRVASPNALGASTKRVTNLASVAAVSAHFAMAVGTFSPDPSTSALESLAMRWTGTRWVQVASPDPGGTADPSDFTNLSAVAALSPRDAWAVGEATDSSTRAVDSVVLHWNGRKWSRFSSPNPSTTATYLFAVAAVSARAAWAVGSYYDSATKSDYTLILRWDGTSWLPA